jgi:hypothetical protein
MDNHAIQPKKKKKTTKLGQAFAGLRWGRVDEAVIQPDGTNRAAVAMARRRWAGVSPEERSRLMSQAGRSQQKGKPRDPQQKRCPCGTMTLARAEARAGKTGTSKGHRAGCRFYKAA